ncbi:hypothetical protein [Flavobacterium poyangense]|uniref:hypothetical protein n=1 Tax=Flavobacterium poyangense TaxID=2204302 RepID=UPI001AB03FBA|nr:hypothetical protein [Flavobacterium sp. JXAS1]
MHRWKYAKLVDVFRGKYFEVSSLEELQEVLKQFDSITENTFVRVNIPKASITEVIAYKTEEAGGDEFLYKN